MTRRAALLLAVLPILPAAAQAPSPRSRAVVDAAHVTLGDLFEHAGPRADTVLGPAPAPGRRFVVEGPQLAAIARDFGLGWQPFGGEARVVVERPGRAMRREELLDPLREELATLGADPAFEPDVPGFQPPVLPLLAGTPRVAVDGAQYDPATQRFAATLVVVAEGMPTFTQRVAGRMVAMRDVVLAARALRAGEVLRDGDLELQRQPADRVRAAAAQGFDAVLGQRLRRAVPAGQALTSADVTPVALVARDAPVLLLHEAPGLTLTAQGRALEDAFPGRSFPVLNLASGTVVLAEALDGRHARAMGAAPPGSIPNHVAARAAPRNMP
ncbi:MAG: flagellar basal body P-ring formation chaperone FlgA [Acetobacteraceae bacterium]|nr:flagellar basal body P-ring formation chaperone FlgA [Acetobacteraceae bacterium]